MDREAGGGKRERMEWIGGRKRKKRKNENEKRKMDKKKEGGREKEVEMGEEKGERI